MTKTISGKLCILIALSLLFLLQACTKDNPQLGYKYLTQVTSERRITKAEATNAFSLFSIISTKPLESTCDIDVAAITYTTTGVDGKPTQASGVVAMCAGTTSYENLLSIQHGTSDMEQAPSRVLFNHEMAPVIKQRVVVMADYLGYGANQTPTRQHPYMHTATTGTACADMIEAAREYLHSKGIKEISDKVELMGYSQGGTATVATLLEMEKRGTASRIIEVHSAGTVYDLERFIMKFVESGNEPYPRNGYLSFLIRGMEYGEQMKLIPEKIYSPAVISKGLLTAFDTKPLSELNDLLGTDITQVLNPDFYAAPTFNNNTEIIKLIAALRKNSLLSLSPPATPITIYHTKTDELIPFATAQAAHNKWKNSTFKELTLEGHFHASLEFILKYIGLESYYQ